MEACGCKSFLHPDVNQRFVIPCAVMSSAASSSTSQIQAAMAKTNELFTVQVFGQRQFDALDDIYTSAATILPPGAPMRSGLPAIKEFWSSFIQSANAKSAKLETVDLAVAGDDVVEIGRATITVQPEDSGALVPIAVKYVVHWRQENGTWKWQTDIWNLDS